MTDLDRVLSANSTYASSHGKIVDPRPSRRLAIVTCMDARIDVFAALGLELGEAHVIRNAGARVTDDVLRSLTVSSHLLGVDTVIVVQHTNCGLVGVTDDELRARTGAELAFLPIDEHAGALRNDIESLINKPYLGPIKVIAGFVYDLESGHIAEKIRWQRPAEPSGP